LFGTEKRKEKGKNTMEGETRRKVTVETVNASKGYRYEGFTEETDRTPGEIFRIARAEYGKCISKVYLDVSMGDGTFDTKTCGWVFQKKVQYSDCNKFYTQETWITVH
jgi:hypothetical protein